MGSSQKQAATLTDEPHSIISASRLPQISWGILWRMIVYGLVFGTLLGGIFTLPLYLSAVPLGAIIGGVIGLILGLADAVAMIVVTILFIRRASLWRTYSTTMYAATMTATAIGGLAGFAWSGTGLKIITETSQWTGWACYVVIPTAIACGGTWFATERVLMWVERVSV